MHQHSSAATRHRQRLRRMTGTVAFLAATATLLPASAPSRPAAPSAGPLVQVLPLELRVKQRITALAADGGRAAFAFCNQLVGVWRPGATAITRLGRMALWTCPPPVTPQTAFSLSVGKDRIAWAVDTGGNVVDNFVFLATLAYPHTLTTIAQVQHCCRGEPDQERVGSVLGDANFLVFATRKKCGDPGAPACASGTTTKKLLSQTVWRIRRPPFQAACVDKPGPCTQLASLNDVLEPIAVDSGRVALRRADGSIVVRNSAGAVVRAFPSLAGLTHGAELMGNRLVVLIQGNLIDLNVTTGQQLHMRSLPRVPSAGVCISLPCLPTTLRLVDASRGLVAYLLSGRLHLLRLRDGHDRVVAPASDARFGDTGLFFAYQAAGAWPGRIRFVAWAHLPLRP